MDLISVVIPVYNVEKYIKQCLDSVLAQTYRNLEIILVDDGSPDSSGEICDYYAKEYDNIKVMHKKNAGLGEARNSGMSIASGEYIFFLDSDDYIASDEIEAQYNAVKKYGVDACYVGYNAVTDDGELISIRSYKDEVFLGEEAKTKLLPRLLGSLDYGEYDRIDMGASCLLYSMRPIRENGIKFVSEREYVSEDLIFNIDYLSVATGACTISKTGCCYRQNPTSLTHQYREGKFEKYKIYYYYVTSKIEPLRLSEHDLNRYKKTFFVQIRNSIRFELVKECPHTFSEKYKIIKHICSDQLVQDVIGSYPVRSMGIQQKIFLGLVKNKHVILLMALLKYRMRKPWK